MHIKFWLGNVSGRDDVDQSVDEVPEMRRGISCLAIYTYKFSLKYPLS